MQDIVDTVNLKELLLNTHSSLLEKQNGSNSKSLRDCKKTAMSVFAKTGFPTTANEEWKYTNLSNILKKEFNFQVEGKIVKEDIETLQIPDLKGNILIFVNGKFSKHLSTILDSQEFLEIYDFSEVAPEKMESYFQKSVNEHDSFSSLNLAFADHSAIIKIAKNKTLLHPIVVYYINDRRTNSVFSQPRLSLYAEQNAHCQIVEYHVSLGSKESFSNAFTDIYLDLDSNIDYYKIQIEDDGAYHVGTTQVEHQAKSNFSATTITLGGSLVRNNLNIALKAERSECYLYGLNLLEGKMHVDNHTLVDHAVPNCYSNELYKGVLSGSSTGVFNGKILVREDAQKTNAFQSNKNILLSLDATMNTKPQLEIFADDVKCSHGATVGQLNEEPLFYLRSRGLSEKKAKALLTLAFAQDIIEHIKIPGLKDSMKSVIEQILSKD